MNLRSDISDHLTHFTKGNTDDEAFGCLQRIVAEQRLIGGGSKIRDDYRCVCFTEAPLISLQNGLVNPNAYSKYSPFGILFKKQWIYQQGGRPVIYQPENEYQLLAEPIRWRHMRYEPGIIDFTWEREWRIKSEVLNFKPNIASIVVPSKKWAEVLIDKHDTQQDFEVYQYSQIMDELTAEQYREEYPWRIYFLR